MRRGADGRSQRSWLAFMDLQLEGAFWAYWEDSSRPIAVLLSFLMAVTWPVGLYNTVSSCRWSAAACTAVGAVQAACAAEHAIFQWLLLTRCRGWRIRENVKAWVLLGDMVACMFIAMLVRDMDEVPGVTHTAAYMVHGWQIFFLQPSVTTSFHLHLLNAMSYAMVEAHLAVNLGGAQVLRGGIKRLMRLLMVFAVLPFLASAACELLLRRRFLQKRDHSLRAAGASALR